MLTNQTVSISVPVPHVFVKDDHAVTTSLDVAGYFNKSHKDVLKAVRAIIESRQQLAGRNFAPGSYTDKNNQTRPMYYMDRKGFTLLVFGFTGPRALDFKIAYIDAFEAMEARLKEIAAEKEKPAVLSDMDLENLQAIAHYCSLLQKHRKALETHYKEMRAAQWAISGIFSMLSDLNSMPGELRLHMDQLLKRHNLLLK